MKHIITILLLLFAWCASAQQRPDLFPLKSNLEATDEHYTQAGGTAYRIVADSARMFYSPDIDLVALAYNIDSTGTNIVDSLRGRFVIDLSGDWWYVDKDKAAVAIGTGNVAAQTLSFSNPNLTISNGNTVNLSALSTSPDSSLYATLYALQDTASTLRIDLAATSADSTIFATLYRVDTAKTAIRTEIDAKADASHTHTESDITDLSHFTGADITGSESAFTGWDKNASDDFDGAFSSLTGIPAGLSDGDDIGLTSVDSTIFASVYRVDTASAAIRSEIPTNNNQLTNGAGYITQLADDTTPQAGGELDMQGNNIVDLADVTFSTGASGGTLRTGTSNADKFALQAYDVNGGTYTTLMEADAGNEPYMQIFVDYFRFEDAADDTKIATFDVSGITTGTTRTFAFPDASGTFELEGHTHTESEITDLGSYLTGVDSTLFASVYRVDTASAAIRGELHDAVTFAGTGTYITLAGQQITVDPITESDITDLQSYLTAETNNLTAAVTWANVPDANITQTSVTQHQAALTITESQISDLAHTVNTDDQAIDVIQLDSFLFELSLESDAEATKQVNFSRFGTVGPSTDAVFTAAFTAKKGLKNLVNCTGGTVTVTPPSTPAAGDTFSVVDARANSGTNNITIDFVTATQNLYGSSQNYILNSDGGAVEFYYIGATTGWITNK